MKYNNNDVRKFKTGTPNKVWSTMVRCWETEPTSDRIVDDILAFPRVLKQVVDAQGCVVADDKLRSGRRYVAIGNRRALKNREIVKRNRQ